MKFLLFPRCVLAGCLLFLSLVPASSATLAQDRLPSTLDFWQQGDEGERLNLRGRVIDEAGEPVNGAEVALRQADGTSSYIPRYSGILVTDERGTFSVSTVIPGQYTSEKHIHVRVAHEDYQPRHLDFLFTGDPYKGSPRPDAIDVVLETVTQGDEQRSIGGVEIVLVKR